MYVLIGSALSWWETSEQNLASLLRQLCGRVERLAMETFQIAPRAARYKILQSAMKQYAHLFEGDEIERVNAALKNLNRLAEVRNEIAHGFVSEINAQVDEKKVASGCYLVPAFQEGSYAIGDYKYHHVPLTIAAFIEDLRKWRAEIMEVTVSIAMREQAKDQHFPWPYSLEETARNVAARKFHGREALAQLQSLIDLSNGEGT